MSGKEEFAKALISGDITAVKQVLKENPQVLNNTVDWPNNSGFALNCAAAHDQPDVIEFLVKEGNADVNRQQGVECLWTPLHHAQARNACKAAAMLLNLGANPALKNENGDDTAQFCKSREVQKLLDPGYHQKEEEKKEQARQEKIQGKWTRITDKEVIHTYDIPENHSRITDTFNFELRFWRETVKDTEDKSMAMNIMLFDDMQDTEILHQACQKLKELHGNPDESLIDSRALRGKLCPLKP